MRRQLFILAIVAAAQFRFVFICFTTFNLVNFTLVKEGRSTQTADKSDMKLNDKCVGRIRLNSDVSCAMPSIRCFFIEIHSALFVCLHHCSSATFAFYYFPHFRRHNVFKYILVLFPPCQIAYESQTLCLETVLGFNSNCTLLDVLRVLFVSLWCISKTFTAIIFRSFGTMIKSLKLKKRTFSFYETRFPNDNFGPKIGVLPQILSIRNKNHPDIHQA